MIDHWIPNANPTYMGVTYLLEGPGIFEGESFFNNALIFWLDWEFSLSDGGKQVIVRKFFQRAKTFIEDSCTKSTQK